MTRRRFDLGLALKVLVVLLMAVGFLFPLYWMVTMGLKGKDEIMLYPPTLFPHRAVWSNFVKATTTIPFWRWAGNSLYLGVMITLGTVITCPLVAYGLAWVPFRGRNLVFTSLIVATLIPFTATMIPMYVIWAKLGLVNTFWPLIIPAFLGTPGLIFMLRQFFRSLPAAMIEAAQIDGANHFQIFRHIMLPLSKAAVAVAAVWAFIGSWSDFFGPLLYAQDDSMYTIQLGLTQYRSYETVHVEWQMAGATLTVIPVVLVILLVQRWILQQEFRSGIKG
jgi:multiple sugar transport system permease protein